MVPGAAALTAALLILAREVWKRARYRMLAVFPVLLSLLCAAAAVISPVIVWKEPPCAFSF